MWDKRPTRYHIPYQYGTVPYHTTRRRADAPRRPGQDMPAQHRAGRCSTLRRHGPRCTSQAGRIGIKTTSSTVQSSTVQSSTVQSSKRLAAGDIAAAGLGRAGKGCVLACAHVAWGLADGLAMYSISICKPSVRNPACPQHPGTLCAALQCPVRSAQAMYHTVRYVGMYSTSIYVVWYVPYVCTICMCHMYVLYCHVYVLYCHMYVLYCHMYCTYSMVCTCALTVLCTRRTASRPAKPGEPASTPSGSSRRRRNTLGRVVWPGVRGAIRLYCMVLSYFVWHVIMHFPEGRMLPPFCQLRSHVTKTCREPVGAARLT